MAHRLPASLRRRHREARNIGTTRERCADSALGRRQRAVRVYVTIESVIELGAGGSSRGAAIGLVRPPFEGADLAGESVVRCG
jgi:hypothetical protein